ncbi:MAG: hypothetical protein DMG65_05530 [Candidatus Angelobacter sp. Gp1-AA117]|nr:MAG: hypothetical protein DMG65_05530 [Candidatus Angelobacter sp. Gp1-AA117]
MNADKNRELVEGEDFYIENGLYVFTREYLLKRGFCCQSGCRHCPYGFVKSNQQPLSEKNSK